MALVSQLKPVRFEIPHEPDQWVDLVPPSILTLDRLRESNQGKGIAEATIQILLHCVKGWSYDAPPDEATLSDLDPRTYNWLTESLNSITGLGDAEKKDSANGSSPTTAPALAASPVSSSS